MGLFGPIAAWARPGHSVAGVLASLALSLACWPFLTGNVQGPSIENAATATLPAAPAARLTREGNDLIITGSVALLFNTGSFSGPNRAEKVNRARLTPDGVTVSSGFDALRTHLASLRTPGGASGSSTIAMPAIPTVEVASIDPSQSAALGAIDQIVPMAAPTR